MYADNITKIKHILPLFSGWYVFVDSAQSAQFGSRGDFVSEHFPATDASCLEFYYQMYGDGMY